jgi:hypothetical protein
MMNPANWSHSFCVTVATTALALNASHSTPKAGGAPPKARSPLIFGLSNECRV